MGILFDLEAEPLEFFLTRWYGPPQRIDGIDQHGADAIPEELREWHRTVSRWDSPVTFQDEPVPLSEVRRQPNGMLTFWVESQGAYVWATAAGHGENRVFKGDSPVADDWVACDLTLREFLVHATLTEAVTGARHRVAVPSMPAGQVYALLDDFVPVRLRSAASPDPVRRLFVGEDALAEILSPPGGHPGGPDFLRLHLAGVDDAALQRHLARIAPEYLVWGPAAGTTTTRPQVKSQGPYPDWD